MQNHTPMISKSSYLVLVHGVTDLINMSTGFLTQTLQTQACQSGSVCRLDGYSFVSFLYRKSH